MCYRSEADNIVIHSSYCGCLAECCVLVIYAHHRLGRICSWPHRCHLHHQLEEQWCVSQGSKSAEMRIKQECFIITWHKSLTEENNVLFFRSFVSYTMAVITINFIIPLLVMFYCYYNVSVTVKRYKANNCLESINMDWSDQMDVTKASRSFLIW